VCVVGLGVGGGSLRQSNAEVLHLAGEVSHLQSRVSSTASKLLQSADMVPASDKIKIHQNETRVTYAEKLTTALANLVCRTCAITKIRNKKLKR